ncbi:hypothetical protein CAPTEDRAFT_198926 [Capitella teleta]|uniref:Uncharacterized protein n=1 Tax=Capitella teleta TaxID=283909 RepID=R7UT25_CAPTE|nr:hypothetical protein CAPTEDRAFT_198926 [Capitella teleta]|eukprot:ELU09323.1 hypothetical protein CAPTEDRAFT_198926 [Capitella teleta]
MAVEEGTANERIPAARRLNRHMGGVFEAQQWSTCFSFAGMRLSVEQILRHSADASVDVSWAEENAALCPDKNYGVGHLVTPERSRRHLMWNAFSLTSCDRGADVRPKFFARVGVSIYKILEPSFRMGGHGSVVS